jgi:hypothetical protein
VTRWLRYDGILPTSRMILLWISHGTMTSTTHTIRTSGSIGTGGGSNTVSGELHGGGHFGRR